MLIVDNMATFAAGDTIQPDHYMNMQTRSTASPHRRLGLHHSRCCSTPSCSPRTRPPRPLSQDGHSAGLFNINEPVIYGYPIVYNLPLMIPFVLLPDLFIGSPMA